MIPVAALEEVVILGGAQARTILAGVAEESPAQTRSLPGQTDQVVTLLVNPDEQLWPPTRVSVRGRECRVLGRQSVPWAGVGALVTCVRVNPDLPDWAEVVRRTESALGIDGRLSAVDESLWAGPVHIVTELPWVVDSGGAEATVDKATVALPLDAPYEPGLVLKVTESRALPAGVELTLMGQSLDSTADLRRVAGYRRGRGST